MSTARKEKNAVRNWIRQFIVRCKNDWRQTYKTYSGEIKSHSEWADKFEMRIIKWDARHHAVLVLVRNTDYPICDWNTDYCQWVWVNTDGHPRFWSYKLWEAANQVACSFDR